MFEPLEHRVFLSTVQTSFMGEPFDVNGVIQAEDFDRGGEGVAYHDADPTNRFGGYRPEGPDIESTTDAGGGYNVGFIKAGEWLEYSVNVPADGTYHVGFRIANMRGGGSFHLADGDTGANLTGTIAVPNTGAWQTYATVGKDVELTAGVHVLRVAFDSNASSGYTANFNWFSVLANARAPYPGPAPFTFAPGATLQAENFDAGGEGVTYHDLDAANLGGAYRTPDGVDIQPTADAGGGYNVGWAKAGEWLEYTVNVPSPGTYDVGFRVSNIAPGGSFRLTEGGNDLTGSITVPSTGGWQTFTTVNRGVTLAPGIHVLRLTFEGNASNGYAGNLNWIKINAAPRQTPFPGPGPFVFAPGNKLELEHFDNGGEGVAYHDSEPANLVPFFRANEGVEHTHTLDAGGGFNVDLVKAGEWLEYTVNVPVAGTFDVNFRVANIRNGGSFHLSDAEASIDLTGPVAVPSTGDWQKYTTVTRKVSLSAGLHVLRLTFDSNSSAGWAGNFNWLSVG
jgi:hypothetical protein